MYNVFKNGQTVLLKDDNLLKKHHTIWDKISTNIKNKFDGEPVYNNCF